MRRRFPAFAALALSTLAGCTWLVGVNGDVQLEPTGDATTEHDAGTEDASDAPTAADSSDAPSDGWPGDEDGEAIRDANAPDARDADGDARG